MRAVNAAGKHYWRPDQEESNTSDGLNIGQDELRAAFAAWRKGVRTIIGLLEQIPEAVWVVVVATAAVAPLQGRDFKFAVYTVH